MMLTWNIKIILLLIFITGGSLICSCVSRGPDTRFYILDPLPLTAPLVENADPENTMSIEIASLRLPQYLERPQIVTRDEGNRLKMAELHQWGGNLRKNMIRVIVDGDMNRSAGN